MNADATAEVPQPPPRRPVTPGVCGVPTVPGGREHCGEHARLHPCGWRCEGHAPGREDAAFRVLVTGSRSWCDPQRIYTELDALLKQHPDLLLVHGACAQGADAIADRWAIRNGIPVERHPADWSRIGRSAGFHRNAAMTRAGADICIAFIDVCEKRGCREPMPHGSHGAEHCAGLADEAGIDVVPFRTWDPEEPAAGDAA